MHKIFLYPLVIIGLVITIPTIAFEEKPSTLDVKYKFWGIFYVKKPIISFVFCKTGSATAIALS